MCVRAKVLLCPSAPANQPAQWTRLAHQPLKTNCVSATYRSRPGGVRGTLVQRSDKLGVSRLLNAADSSGGAMDSVLLIVALGAVAAGFVQGLSGFGFGMVAMSFWAWTLEPRLAAVLAVCGALTGQLVAAATVRRGFDRARLLPFVLGGLAGIPIGVAVLPRLDIDAFKVILGTLLVLWCPAMLMAKQLPRITRGGRVADAVVGLARGVVGALPPLPAPRLGPPGSAAPAGLWGPRHAGAHAAGRQAVPRHQRGKVSADCVGDADAVGGGDVDGGGAEGAGALGVTGGYLKKQVPACRLLLSLSVRSTMAAIFLGFSSVSSPRLHPNNP